MRFLHTSDWHLGKKLEGRSRLEEQNEVLDEINQICDDKNIDVILLSGDVFDTFTPSAEAEDLFYEKAVKMTHGKRIMICISGNHDDYKRLRAISPLSEKLGIYIIGTNKDIVNVKETKIATKIINSGEGYLIIQKDDEKVFVNALPYPSDARFKEVLNEVESYGEKVKRWAEEVFANNTEKLPQILMSHIFTTGGIKSKDEREIDLGGIRSVAPEFMPEAIYTALGHFHKFQPISTSRNIYYSGSILQYSFDETMIDKKVIVFDIEKEKIQNLEFITLNQGKKLIKVMASRIEEVDELLKEVKNCYVELTLNFNEPLSYQESKRIREDYPFIVSIIININREDKQEESVSTKLMTKEELFRAYYRKNYNDDAPKELLEMFLSIFN